MKNITVSVDEKTHRMARIRAAELDTSVSALVRQYLRDLVSGGRAVPANGATEAATGVEAPETRRHRGGTANSGARTLSFPERMSRQEAQQLRIRMYEVLDEIWAAHPGFRAEDNLSRDEIYDRGRARIETAGLPRNPSDDEGCV
ncbi:MAG: hypothetical protein F4Y37_13220 [Caldilineaceae bacterium SB0664_bin_22]|nr:hypothetical protein [Caldilineaceae bacterium SB0664_bin_22]